ncbi:2TM domain-containing protein [Flavobacterium sp. ZS1P14]|uniref:2TM domain-containing protein n=1 Tax=Flavobacterium sp. ZS1P14 TaxID=3401729 RepID=UPI003AADB4B7
MGRFRRSRLNDYNNNYNTETYNPDERYTLAYKRVKRIKGFYVHLLVYFVVNAFIIISSFDRSLLDKELFWRWETFSTALFWGIGLIAHALSVFGRNIFFGPKWEEKKIQELMEKEKSEKWE